jgi:LmbE family N-acetylglucosaminyl deacetylase
MAPPPAPALPAHRLAALGDTVCVFAHPDDETYLCAGAMAAVRAAGHRVTCITATRGEGGGQEDPVRLASLRAAELERALAVLGVDEHVWLDVPDGRCADVPPGPLVDRLEQVLRTVRPRTVLTFGPDGITGHPDHVTVGAWSAVALDAAGLDGTRLLEAAVTVTQRTRFRDIEDDLGVHIGEPAAPTPDADLAVHAVLDGDLLDRKLAALAALASQTEPVRQQMGDEAYRAWVAVEAFRPATRRTPASLSAGLAPLGGTPAHAGVPAMTTSPTGRDQQRGKR